MLSLTLHEIYLDNRKVWLVNGISNSVSSFGKTRRDINEWNILRSARGVLRDIEILREAKCTYRS